MLGFLYILRFSRYTKIGIAKANLERRYRDIDRTTKGRQRIALALLVYNPRKVEAALHRKYARYRTRLQGSGGTEWFKLGMITRAGLYLHLAWIQVLHLVAGLVAGYAVLWIIFNLYPLMGIFFGQI